MKLEVGMYVRTIKGHLAQLIEIENLFNQDGEYGIAYGFDKEIDGFNTDITYEYAERIIKKTNYDIKKLIEVGDYVNGYKVDSIIEWADTKELICNDYNLDDSVITIKEEDIKTIVTKEQFESMNYKVGEYNDRSIYNNNYMCNNNNPCNDR